MTLIDLLRAPADDAIRHFLEAWHGPPSRTIPETPPGPMPEAIRRLAAFSEAWPAAIVQNTLELDPDWGRDGDKRVFFVENQGVYLWATEGVGDDPVVWGRFYEPGEPWVAEREPLSRFLLQMVVFEAIMGAPSVAAASSIGLPALEAALRPFGPSPFGPWRWPAEPARFYANADALAFVNPNDLSPPGPGDHVDLQVGARSARALAYLRDITGIDWDVEPG